MDDAGVTEAGAVLRRAGRAVVLDEDGRILLFAGTDRGQGRRKIWYTPGGGVEDGETYEQAARRELWEETGRHFALGPLVWVRRRVRSDPDLGTVDSRSHFFLVRTRHFEIDLTAIPAGEDIQDYRWFTLAEIEAEPPESFVPQRLAELLPPLLDGTIPAQPADASDARGR